MFKNYLKIAARNLLKHRVYSLINIIGLAVGMACTFLILLWVQDELSYDRYHARADQIYRLVVDMKLPEKTILNALTSAPMAARLLEDYPEVLEAVRFLPFGRDRLVRHGDRHFYEGGIFYTDASIFKMFSFPFVKGDPETALANPNTIVITKDMAEKYFGDKDPIGENLRLYNVLDYKVTGIIENVPQNSHFHFDFLVSFKSLESIMGSALQNWQVNPFYTYVLLPNDYPVTQLEAKLPAMVDKYVGETLQRVDAKWQLRLQPLTNIHLNPRDNEIKAGSSIQSVYLFSAIAILILMIACINFMNLSTTRAITRAKEVSIRKVIGAQRRQLVVQFLGDSLLQTLMALGLAMVLIDLFLPSFNGIIERELHPGWNLPVFGGLIGTTLLVGVLSGSYPAFFLSGFQPLKTMKGLGSRWGSKRPQRFRGALVVFQFSISVILIVATLIVYMQLNFMKEKKLGLQPEQVVVVPVRQKSVRENADILQSQMLQQPGVLQVAFSSRKPGTGAGHVRVQREEAPTKKYQMPKRMLVDHNFIPMLDIELTAGRNFSEKFTTDISEAFILNEKAVQDLGWSTPSDAIGKRIVVGETHGKIAGVVRDFHILPLRSNMFPLVIKLAPPKSLPYMLVKVSSSDIATTIEDMEQTWNRLAPDWPFIYSFLDDDYQDLYQTEERFGKIFSSFTSLALLIACLGLFGLAFFSAEQRTREIGTRKVLGASVSGIVRLLSKDFVKLVLLANLIAWPLAWLTINRWLQNYAYRTEIGGWVFVLAGGLVLVIAFLTVSTQAIRAALANPVESLRYE